jgi:hypothetical protein
LSAENRPKARNNKVTVNSKATKIKLNVYNH